MAVCTFFGHRDCPSTIRPRLSETLVELIERNGVDIFYVGNQGAFDAIVRSVLREMTQEYPHINYAVVLAYMPAKQDENYPQDYSDTMLPEGIEAVPKRFAISWRNKWMLNHSEYVVTYITHSWGGAAQFAELAERRGQVVIKLGDLARQ